MKKILLVTLILHSSLFSIHMQAQSLEHCIAYAKEHSFMVKQSELQVARAKRNENTYFELEKTELSLSQDPTTGGSPDNALTLSQNIDFPTVYGSRKKLLKAETRVAESQHELTFRKLVKEIATAYSSLLYFHQQVLLLQKNDSILDSFVRIANSRVANGETNLLELMNAKQQKASNLQQLKLIRNNEIVANLKLQQIINTNETIVPVGDLISFLDEWEEGSTVYNYAQSISGKLMGSEIQLKERELNLIRHDLLPSFSLGWRHQLLLSGINPYGIERTRFEKGNWMGFEFGISFPLFYGSKKAKVAVAKYDFDIAKMQNNEICKQQQTEFAIALRNLYVTKENLNQYKTELLLQATEMRSLSQVEYEAGEISYVEHIQNLSSSLSVELQMAEAANEHNKAIITFKYIQ